LLFYFSANLTKAAGKIDRKFAVFILVITCVDLGFAVAIFTTVHDQNLQYVFHLLPRENKKPASFETGWYRMDRL